MSDSAPAAAGWYPDITTPGGERYWDGARWTEHRRDGQGRVPLPVPRGDNAGLEQWATLWSVLFPILGLAQGIILLDRGSPKAKRIIVVSSILMVLYAVLGVLAATSP